MDTKFFQQALDEWRERHPKRKGVPLGNFTATEFSEILQGAQKLKKAEASGPQPIVDALDTEPEDDIEWTRRRARITGEVEMT